MYITKVPFKSYGVHYGRGSVITDPSAIKLFKAKQGEGKIIRVHNDQKSRDFITNSAAKFSIAYPDNVLIHVGLKAAVVASTAAQAVALKAVAPKVVSPVALSK